MRYKMEDQVSVELNHTIIPAKDKWVSAKFLGDILNLEAGPEWGHFVPVKTANGVTLDFDTREEFRPGHYASLVSDAEFDAAFARIRAQGVRYLCPNTLPEVARPSRMNDGELEMEARLAGNLAQISTIQIWVSSSGEGGDGA